MRTRFVAAGLLLAIPIVVLAQQAQPDTLTALLNEVRQLRIALERSALTGPQIQLLSSRLTVQNERVSRATRDLETLRMNLARASGTVARFTAQAQEMEQALATEPNQERRRQIAGDQRALKQQLEELTAEEQRLRLQEAELANTLATEQTNWNELNRRLDELERALAAGNK